MRIEYKTKNILPLSEVQNGDVFTKNDGIYIKTSDIDAGDVLAVDLENGDIVYYEPDKNVEILDCYLVMR